MNTNTCNHWACNKEDNTCVGCGAIICPICLKVPVNCKCENKDICCTEWSHTIIIYPLMVRAFDPSVDAQSLTFQYNSANNSSKRVGFWRKIDWRTVERKSIDSNWLLCTRIQKYICNIPIMVLATLALTLDFDLWSLITTSTWWATTLQFPYT